MTMLPFIRKHMRAFYLCRQLDQIALNRAYYLDLSNELKRNLIKLDGEEAVARHELGTL